ncbi:dolichyl-phosphate-mannose--protein mannosyltransferase [Nocardioides bruguierae]|uniref:dolichyl-phosphate-mannose--protein mannosyltransferase n=1 Tax=Nocardioides bruguierae TaxID=2945102 RepID=UPI002021AD00|nr:phospholipid carrier-dependent glycosyltransferase [Nocardioides bruguierae]MCL8024990.1 phospholipid carrier-dependent glycosyltransferase [Nocardioides bruguierae]
MSTQAPEGEAAPRPGSAQGPAQGAAERQLLSRSAGGSGVPSAWQRARHRLRGEDPVIAWASALALGLLALFLRLWHLGRPAEFEFDETYYAKDAWSLINHGYVQGYVDDANDQILDGTVRGLWDGEPSMIVHPEVGKWLIGLGEKLFGMDPFGWRIAAAVIGSLMIVVMVRLVRRLTRSLTLGLVAGVLLMLDGMQFVLSRLALLDIFCAFFLLCAVAAIAADRDWFRRRLADRLPAQVDGGFGPVRGLLLRPWLIVAGVSFGLAAGTKWTAAYPLAAFGVLVWLWSAGARRSFGVRGAWLRSALVDGLGAFAQLVLVALVVYVTSWTGWLVHASQYEEHLSSTQYTQFTGSGHCDGESFVSDDPDPDARWPTATEPDASGLGEVVQSLRSLWYYHQDVYTFHTHFLNCATHTYQSQPSGWLFLNRPVGVAADTGIEPGTRGCTAPEGSDCLRQVLLIGTPVLWWGGCIALLFSCVMWVLARDWRHGVAVVGTASTWLPWLLYDERPIFLFYAILTLPFLVLSVTLGIGHLIGPSREPTARRTIGVVVSGSFVVLVLLNFAWFWPIFTNQLLTHSQWLGRIWFERWI